MTPTRCAYCHACGPATATELKAAGWTACTGRHPRPTTLNGSATSLERRGLVRLVEAGSEDRRKRPRWTATDAGRELARELRLIRSRIRATLGERPDVAAASEAASLAGRALHDAEQDLQAAQARHQAALEASRTATREEQQTQRAAETWDRQRAERVSFRGW